MIKARLNLEQPLYAVYISHVGVRINFETKPQSRTTCVIKIYFTIRNGETRPGAHTFLRAAPGSSRHVFLVYINTKRTALFFLSPGRALLLKSSNCKSMKNHHKVARTPLNCAHTRQLLTLKHSVYRIRWSEFSIT